MNSSKGVSLQWMLGSLIEKSMQTVIVAVSTSLSIINLHASLQMYSVYVDIIDYLSQCSSTLCWACKSFLH